MIIIEHSNKDAIELGYYGHFSFSYFDCATIPGATLLIAIT